jgi:hypothetical protein
MSNRQNSRKLRNVLAGHWFSDTAKKLRLAMGPFRIATPHFEIWTV